MKYLTLLIVVGLSGCATPKPPPVHTKHHKHSRVAVAAATTAPAPETPIPFKNLKGDYRLLTPTPTFTPYNPELEPR